jgi:glycosyltransferase involved in cell wall biosynthesis
VGDPGAQADALAEALSLGASARSGLAERARAHVSARFSVADAAESILAAYVAALTRESPRDG